MKAAVQPGLRTILRRLRNAEQVMFALDFDGTLAPIAENPGAASMPPETLGVLRELAGLGNVSLAILSGRSLSDLKARIGLKAILAGNHGLEIEFPDSSFIHPEAKALRHGIELACRDLERSFEDLPGIFVENKGLTATVHYRLAPTGTDGWLEATVHEVIHPFAPWLTVNPARKAWEILPRISWNKGSALDFLLRQTGFPEAFVVCAGDDAGDETMFGRSHDRISIHVGRTASTNATFCVGDPSELRGLLSAAASYMRNQDRRSASHRFQGPS